MEAKDVLKELRQRHNMTQDQLSEKLAVTRQAVSRWENGESVPNPETLKQLSALFDTSINHLLGDPRKLICQCCGMPLDSDEQNLFQSDAAKAEALEQIKSTLAGAFYRCI